MSFFEFDAENGSRICDEPWVYMVEYMKVKWSERIWDPATSIVPREYDVTVTHRSHREPGICDALGLFVLGLELGRRTTVTAKVLFGGA